MTKVEELKALLALEQGDRIGALLALEAAEELAAMGQLDPRPEFNPSGLAQHPAQRIRALRDEVSRGR